ncbi:hypothetical protein, variant [Loa loa]|uniref:Uncharacterized protein n=1 Tax=Loa loa TaxID=7209 RepID=A0A1S0UIV5_LOALO|nr:hypothetical protein, variant [Loa loa]EJD75642.1 hypothetical protein, variant [Loa loa]
MSESGEDIPWLNVVRILNHYFLTLWAVCRAIVFGGVIITFGILMTILGYFDVYLSQEIVHSGDDGTDKMSTNWTKRYLFKSLQYLGPVVMGIGSFILIVACVITLESRDKNTQVLHNVEADPCKKTSLLQRDVVQKRLPMTDEEIREWTPLYKAVPLSRCDSSPIMAKKRKYRSTPCIPQMLLDDIYNRKLCGRYFDSYYCGIFNTENDLVLDMRDHGRVCASTSEHCSRTSHWQDVTVELHSPPPMLLSSTIRSLPLQISPISPPQHNQSELHHVCCSTSDFSNLVYNEHNSSNVIVAIDPIANATTTDTVDFKTFARDSCTIPERFERHAPLASLDIECGTSSSSSSSNMKVPNDIIHFTI